jgi:hypothetical protein
MRVCTAACGRCQTFLSAWVRASACFQYLPRLNVSVRDADAVGDDNLEVCCLRVVRQVCTGSATHQLVLNLPPIQRVAEGSEPSRAGRRPGRGTILRTDHRTGERNHSADRPQDRGEEPVCGQTTGPGRGTSLRTDHRIVRLTGLCSTACCVTATYTLGRESRRCQYNGLPWYRQAQWHPEWLQLPLALDWFIELPPECHHLLMCTTVTHFLHRKCCLRGVNTLCNLLNPRIVLHFYPVRRPSSLHFFKLHHDSLKTLASVAERATKHSIMILPRQASQHKHIHTTWQR